MIRKVLRLPNVLLQVVKLLGAVLEKPDQLPVAVRTLAPGVPPGCRNGESARI